MRRLFFLLLLATLLGVVLAGAGYLFLRHEAPAWGGAKILTLTLDAPLREHDVEPTLPFVGDEERISLSLLYRGFLAARTDPSVVAVALYIHDASFGLAKAQELRRQIAELDRLGKPVHCYLETAGEGGNGTLEYYVASACSSLALAPAGEINLLGLFADSPFLRGGLDQAQDRSELSDGRRIQERRRDLHRGAALAGREERRSRPCWTVSTTRSWTASPPAARPSRRPCAPGWTPRRSPPRARSSWAWSTSSPIRTSFATVSTSPPTARRAMLQRVAFLDYARDSSSRLPGGRRVAVLFAQGAIVRGDSGSDPFASERLLGSADMATELRDLAEDDAVVAVVLRIDSPGGSALASDLILREVELLAAEKPLVVSMSDVAASGGYYIAARASRIVAEPATITGSIGVVTGKLATGRFQEELLGITHDPLQRGANADLYSEPEAVRRTPDGACCAVASTKSTAASSSMSPPAASSTAKRWRRSRGAASGRAPTPSPSGSSMSSADWIVPSRSPARRPKFHRPRAFP